MTQDDYGLSQAIVTPEAQASAEPEDAPAFERLTFDALMAREPKQWLVSQIFGAGDLVQLYGAPGSGKTFVAFDLIGACLAGRRFAGRFDVAKPLHVCYAASEGLSGLRDRFAALAAWHNLAPDDLARLEVVLDVPQLFDGQSAQSAAQFLASQRKPVDLLVIDTQAHASAGAGENDARDASLVLAGARLLQRSLGCCVLLIHHANKAGTSSRGSGAYEAAADCQIEIAQNGVRVMRCAKLKDGERWPTQRFSIDVAAQSAVIGWLGDDERLAQAESKAPILDCLQQSPGKRFLSNFLAQELGMSRQATSMALARLVLAGAVKRALADDGKPASNRNPYEYWIDASLGASQ